jgi:BASS family bile acid:Na+ symporter
MLGMGASLTIPMILEPLKNVKLVILALVANFILVPALAPCIKQMNHFYSKGDER